MTRKLSPYEKTHLKRFGKGQVDITDFGEMPVEYITGQVEFAGYVFRVSPNVLIPRIESEELVNLAFYKIKQIHQKKNKKLVVADIGCGSGAVGISLFLKLQKKSISIKLYLSDISSKALAVTKTNVSNLINESTQVHWLKSDLLRAYPADLKFDLIIANLPYIPSQRIPVLDKSVRDYEPYLALDGGKEGLRLIKKLVKQAKNRLNSSGLILLEVDYTHNEELLQKSLELSNFDLNTSKNQSQKTRFALIKRKS